MYQYGNPYAANDQRFWPLAAGAFLGGLLGGGLGGAIGARPWGGFGYPAYGGYPGIGYPGAGFPGYGYPGFGYPGVPFY
ncbi:hypothetical protein D1B31_07890 [Neobacillus notoginsengisoli]|uniref:Uncharacterized protein n=1 Tax=Neobacillus notoginsengisoli TaxID=1578198 RepID=A0A417YW37_9BACI|nr:hypothetical protein [Neobacillus notoginsengisoli]RHW41629.1 hypothetical protein D1B31_07890 [Neobacillus notoginsengisoli]